MPEEPQETQAVTESVTEPAAPPWGSDDEFNPEKAWSLIQGLKSDKEKLQARPVITPDQQQQLGEYQRLLEASKSDAERQSEELSRWQSDAQKWRDTAVSARVQALASNDFADPSDAVAAIGDVSAYLGVGGEIDEDAIKKDLVAVLERKPHWRKNADAAPGRVPLPNPAQGSRGGAPVSDPAAEFAAILQQRLTM